MIRLPYEKESNPVISDERGSDREYVENCSVVGENLEFRKYVHLYLAEGLQRVASAPDHYVGAMEQRLCSCTLTTEVF